MEKWKNTLKSTSLDVIIYSGLLNFLFNCEFITSYPLFFYNLFYTCLISSVCYLYDRIHSFNQKIMITTIIIESILILLLIIYVLPNHHYVGSLTFIIILMTLCYDIFKKYLGLFKGLYIGLCSGMAIVIVPSLILNVNFDIYCLLKILIIMLNSWVGSTIRDMPDTEDDKKNNILTIPIYFGNRYTKYILLEMVIQSTLLSTFLIQSYQRYFWILHNFILLIIIFLFPIV